MTIAMIALATSVALVMQIMSCFVIVKCVCFSWIEMLDVTKDPASDCV